MFTPEEQAQAILEAAQTSDLLTKAYHLTRRMQIDRNTPHADELRAMRDLITEEIIRRTDA